MSRPMCEKPIGFPHHNIKKCILKSKIFSKYKYIETQNINKKYFKKNIYIYKYKICLLYFKYIFEIHLFQIPLMSDLNECHFDRMVEGSGTRRHDEECNIWYYRMVDLQIPS